MRKYLDIPLTLIVAVALIIAMLWPIEDQPSAHEGTDKLIHLIVFAALVFPLAGTERFSLVPIFITASIFGGIIELIQTRSNRGADINDWSANIIGIIIGVTCELIYKHLRKH